MNRLTMIQLAAIGLLIGTDTVLAQDATLQCRQRAMYDFCSATMVALNTQAMAKGETATAQKATKMWNGLMGPWQAIETNETRQKAAVRLGLENFSMKTVAACVGKDKGGINDIARIAMDICG